MNEGIININRLKKFFGVAITFKVYLDDNYYGDLKSNSSLNINVPFGPHKVTLTSAGNNVPIEVLINENQRNVDIICQAGWGLLVARPKVVSVNYR
ncbi:MAG: hypothetical protein J6X02_00210 [Bacilli bacterium]|nr:hypothetical protein [Bacilli bacterium]